MAGALFVGAAARSFSIPVFFIEDFSTFLMSTCVFFGLAAVTGARGHISAEFFTDLMSPGVKRARQVLEDAIFVVYAGALGAQVIGLAKSSYESGTQSMGMVPVSLAIPQTIMAIGVLALVARTIANLMMSIRDLARPNAQNSGGQPT